MTRFFSVPFRFLAVGNTITNQSSLPVHNVKRISEVIPIFPSGTSNKLIYRFYSDITGKVSTGTWPGGKNLFEDVAENGELFGDNIAYSIPLQREISDRPLYIKMGAENGLASDLNAGAILIMEGY